MDFSEKIEKPVTWEKLKDLVRKQEKPSTRLVIRLNRMDFSEKIEKPVTWEKLKDLVRKQEKPSTRLVIRLNRMDFFLESRKARPRKRCVHKRT
jgi:L-fucose mutarotase/ribose pyranase (RbsD/FucU family)